MTDLHTIYECPLFKGCDTNIVDALFAEASTKLTAYKEGEIIAMQDSPCRSLLLLYEGSVCTFMTNAEGKELTIERIHAPEVLAPAFIYGSQNYFPVSVQALTSCKIWAVSKESYLNYIQGEESLLRNFLRIISDRSLFLSRKLNEFALQSLSTRLLSYIQRHQRIQNLQEVAFILGVARPSLSRAIAILVSKEVIKKEGNSYVLNT